MLRYNFSCPNFICPLTKNTHTSPINYFGPSQILPILLPNLGPHKYFPYYYQNWVTKLHNLYKSLNSFILWEKPKKPNKILYKARYYTTPYYKDHCYTTLFTKLIATRHSITKPVATQHSITKLVATYRSLLHITLYESCYYMTLFTKPVAT